MMDYYERNGRTCMQAIAVLTENLCGEDAFIVGNIVKYIWRAGMKDGASFEEDLSKAADYALKLCTGRFLEGK